LKTFSFFNAFTAFKINISSDDFSPQKPHMEPHLKNVGIGGKGPIHI
jgi:hypothetical protein